MASEKDATCENDPNFAIICGFFQKFSHMLNIQHLDFTLLQEWLENTDEVTEGLKLLHIKLLRKLRKTVHETAWETALSKFCFGYSAQDAWEIERFGYKKSSLKVKLRILKELIESQFQRNGKFRNTFTAMSADQLRSQPIGRDKLGHSYWLTQDPNLNLRIYQEHLDEEIWQVVASNREELVTLINRLKGNEVVLPSLVGIVDEDTSSSNSCPLLVKPPPPEEKEDESQEEILLPTPPQPLATGTGTTTVITSNEAKVPNIKIKLDTFTIERKADDSCIKKENISKQNVKQENQIESEEGSEEGECEEEMDEEDDGEEEEEDEGGEEEEEDDEFEEEDDIEEVNEKKKSQKVAVNKNAKRSNELRSDTKERNEKETIENPKKTERMNKQQKSQQYERKANDKSSSDKTSRNRSISDKSVIKEKTKDVELNEVSNKGEFEETKVERKVKPLVISQSKNLKIEEGQAKKRPLSELTRKDQTDEEEEDDDDDDSSSAAVTIKRPRPTLLELGAREKKVSKYEKYEEEDDEEEDDEDEEGEEEEEEGEEEGSQDCEDGSYDDDIPVEDEIEEETMFIRGNGSGEDCKSGNFLNSIEIGLSKDDEENIEEDEVGEAIEEDVMIFIGEGSGADCLVGNSKDEAATDKSNFYFGQPGCLKLSPLKKAVESDKTTTKISVDCNKMKNESSGDSENNKNEIVEDLKNGDENTIIVEECKNKEESENEKESESASEKAVDLSMDHVKKDEEKKELKEEKSEKEDNLKENVPQVNSEISATSPIKELDLSKKKEEKHLEKINFNDEENKSKKLKEGCLVNENETTITTKSTATVMEKETVPKKRSNSIEKIPVTNDYSKPPTSTTTGRKRRLSEETFEKPSKQISESDTDINSENIEEPFENLSDEDDIVGGKRLKMRCKQINSDIRKRIEAKRNDIEKETSSSSEAELPLKRLLSKKLETRISPPKLKEKDVNEKEKEKKDVVDMKKLDPKEFEKFNKNDTVNKSESVVDEPKEVIKIEVQPSVENKIVIEQNEMKNAVEKDKASVLDEEDVQPPMKTTRSTRRSITEPLFKDLPQPKRKSRVGRPRKSSTPRAIRNTPTKIKQEEEQQDHQEDINAVIETKQNESTSSQEQKIIPAEDTPKEINHSMAATGEGNSILPKDKIKEEIDKSEDTIVATVNEDDDDNKPLKSKETGSNEANEKPGQTEQPSDAVPAPVPEPKKKQRRKREIDISNIIPEADVAPVRQSRRIAQLKIKEEAERRKLEEIALKKMKEELKKKKKEESKLIGKVEEPSEHSEFSLKDEEEEEEEEESEVDVKKKVERKRKKRTGWSSCTESEAEEEEEELIFDHHESDRASPLLFKSDHEFSPESEIEDSSEVVPLKRARTARKEGETVSEDVEDDQACQKCGKKDHPEWILLCDKCDKGYHCSCLSPVLFIIPEGDWFCPLCQQEQLIQALENHLKEFDELLEKKKEDEIKKELDLKAALEAEAEREAKIAAKIAARSIQKRSKNRKQYSRSGSDEDDDDDTEDDDDEDGRGGKRRVDSIAKRTKKKRKVRGRSYEIRSFSSRSSSKSYSSSSSGSTSSSQSADSDDEPIYKLRKRRQVNVSYRFNEFDDLINSAIKEEMDEVAGAGNLGRGKDISTIIEADKEEKLRQRQLEEQAAKRELMLEEKEKTEDRILLGEEKPVPELTILSVNEEKASIQIKTEEDLNKEDSGSDFEPLKRKPRMSSSRRIKKKKSRKLNCLEVSSEDDGSDEDFKTSSYETEEDEEESLSVPTESESSLEVYKKKSKHKHKKPKKTRRAARRAARNQRKQYEYDSDFVVDGSGSDDIPRIKKKRKEDSDYTETLTDDETEDVDSDELCDDSTDSDESDGAWRPSKRKKQRTIIKKNPQKRKVMSSGKHRKIKRKDEAEKSFRANVSKNKILDDEDSMDSVRRTRGKRFTYLEDYEEESSDGGIKPGVKRPDTPPEEREEFIRKQEEIKRMLAEKNTEAAKVVATPIPKENEKSHSTSVASAVEPTDSLSTVPLSVIKGAKALDIDYLQRKGELRESDEQESDFDDDLPDDFNPEDMDEEAIAKMMDEEDFAQQQPKLTGEAILKKKPKEMESLNRPEPEPLRIPKPGPILQEPPRKRLPMPTLQPPLIRNAPQNIMHNLQATSSRISMNPHRLVPHNLVRPPPQILTSTAGNSILLSKEFVTRTVAATPPPPSVSPPPTQSDLQQVGDQDKPRGRRKKITPLRDTLQKQQAAAAAAAAVVVSVAASTAAMKPTKDSLILDKSLPGVLAGTNLSIAQPPQLYKPAPNAQPSVITRMPQIPRTGFPDQSSRFYPPPNQLLLRPPQRLPGMPLPPHVTLRPSYASGPPPLRSAGNSGPPPSVTIGNGMSRHVPSPFSNSEQYPRPRQPIHPPYRPPLYGTPGYPPAPPPAQLPSPQTQSSHPSTQRQQSSTIQQSSSLQQSSPHSQPSSSPLHPPPQNVIHSRTSNYPVTSYAPGPFGSYFPAQLTASHSTPAPSSAPSISAVQSSVIVSPASIAVQSSITDSTPPSAPTPSTIIEPVHSPPTRPKATPLETFNTKSNPSSLEAESTQSPYSSNEPVDDNDEDDGVPSSNTTSEFSGLVSYFSSQQDDLNT